MRVVYDYQMLSAQQYGGISRYFVELATHVARIPGAEVQIIAPLFRSRFLATRRNLAQTKGMDVSALSWLPVRVVQSVNLPLFRMLAAVAKPEIVHETYYAEHRTAPESAKIVTTVHDTIPERLPHLFRGAAQHREMIRKAVGRADHIICVSESTRRDLLELYSVNPEHVAVAHLASSIVPSGSEPMDIGSPYFLHVGGRYAYKNFHGILQAFRVSGLHRTHKIVAFSSQSPAQEDFELMDNLGIPRVSVVFTGGSDDQLARYYAGAEALVFASMYEGFGIPLLEAMTCGCPVITSNVSSMPEVGGDAALYCDPYDTDSLAGAMMKIASSLEIRAELIARGRARAQQFSWEKCAAETYAVYQKVTQ
ncbi:MAG TPA: glycosyltransferase family 1 protein [Terracidiphilus sp.]|nr:glycosyltransferase family 1 protein [Terracidiphilus sp.]